MPYDIIGAPILSRVLRHFGQNIQRVKHLQITFRSGQEFFVTRFREPARGVAVTLVDRFPRTVVRQAERVARIDYMRRLPA